MISYLDEVSERVRNNPGYIAEMALWDFVESLASEMKRLGISKAELAKRANLQPAQISRILSGYHNLTVRTLAKIAAALEVDLGLHFESRIKVVIPVPRYNTPVPAEFTYRGKKFDETENRDAKDESIAA